MYHPFQQTTSITSNIVSKSYVNHLLERRKETSSCNGVVHLDNAGASLMPDCVMDAYLAAIEEEARIGSYRAQRDASDRFDDLYNKIGDLLNCNGSEVSLLENASRAWDLAFSMTELSVASVIVTTEYEYANNFVAMLRAKKETGCSIELIELDEDGNVSLSHLAHLLEVHGHNIALVSITHVPTHNAIILPIYEIGGVIASAKQAGIVSDTLLYVIDASQTIGQLSLNVEDLGCDVLTFTSRKYLRGPRGLGGVYYRSTSLQRAIEHNQAEPKLLNIPGFVWDNQNDYNIARNGLCFESWETNYSGKLAFKKALEYHDDIKLDFLNCKNQNLSSILRKQLSDIEGINIADCGNKKSSMVTFYIDQKSEPFFAKFIEKQKINVSLLDIRISQINMRRKSQKYLIRISPYYYNTEDEIEFFISVLSEIHHAFQKGSLLCQ
ncbi:MAG: aminotransferase class V-fold PLP-dependent enzyme [Pseudomonadota bacterium]